MVLWFYGFIEMGFFYWKFDMWTRIDVFFSRIDPANNDDGDEEEEVEKYDRNFNIRKRRFF